MMEINFVTPWWILLLLHFPELITGRGDCGDKWIPYSYTKCYRMMDNLFNKEKASALCEEVGSSNYDTNNDTTYTSLLTIDSKDEQKWMTQWVYNESGNIENVWLGASKVNNSTFVWDTDNTNVEYSNWANGHPTNSTEKKCVQMTSRLTGSGEISDGEWSDVSCSKKNAVVCQKYQKWSLETLQRAYLSLQRKTTYSEVELAKSKKKIEALENNPVPYGFIYTQLPGQQEPATIWNNIRWKDVSGDYAGHFFRVVGGDSAAFGEYQTANAPRITSAESTWPSTSWNTNVIVPAGGSSAYILTGAMATQYQWVALRLQSSGGEVRPINQAVRLWMRV